MADVTIDKVQLEIEASAKGVSQVFSQVQSQLNTLKSALSGIDVSKLEQVQKASKSMSINTSGMSKAERDISNSVDKIKQSLAGLKSYKNAALGGDSSALTSFQRRITSIQSAVDVLGEKLKQAGDKRTGVNIDTDQLQTYRVQLAEIQRALRAFQRDARRISKTNIKTDSEGAKKDMDDLADRARKAAAEIAKITGKGISTGWKNLKSGLGGIRSALKDISNRANKGVHKGFMKILRYGFGIRSMYVLFRRLKEAVKDSFGELQKSGAMFQTTKANIDALKTSLSTLKFQFGAAFEPIFNLVAPALQSLINYLISVMNTISAFVAKLTGRSTYSKVAQVISNTGSAAGGAAKGVKELNHQLQGFDELNNLTLDNGNGGGGGGGGGGAGGGAMYEAANVEDALGDFASELADNIRAGKWFEVGRAISDKLSEVMESIDWESIYQKARNFGTGLAEFLNGLITPRLFGNVGKTIASAINTAFEFLNSFGTTFDWENFGKSIGTGITEWFRTANFKLYGETIHTWVSGLLDAGIAMLDNTDFDLIAQKIIDFFNGLNISDLAKKLATFGTKLIGAIAQVIQTLWENASAKEKVGAAIVGLIGVAKLTGLTGILGKAIVNALLGSGSISLASAGLSTLALSLIGVGVAIEGGQVIGNRIGQVFASIINDDELLSYYQEYTHWTKWFPELQEAVRTGNFWSGFDLMLQDMGNSLPGWTDYLPHTLIAKIVNIPEVKNQLKESINTVGNMAYDLVEMERNRFWSRIKKLFEDNGFDTSSGSFTQSVLSKFGFGGLFNEKGQAKLGVEINTKQTGSIKSTKQMRDLGTAWQGFTEIYKDKDADLGTSMLGAFTSYEEVKQGADNFRALDRDFRSKNVTYTTNMGGQIRSQEEIDKARERYENLYNAWNSKSSSMDLTTGGQLDKYTSLDTWTNKFKNLFNNWNSKSATMSANVGGQMSKIGDTDTWTTKIKNLIQNWAGKTANFNAGFNQTQGAIQGYADSMNNLYNSWRGRSADFSVNASFSASDINSIADQLVGRIKKGLEGQFKVTVARAMGGIYSGGSWHNIPQYAGGTLNAGSMFIAGEAGPEIVGSINGRTEVLNRSQIAATVNSAIIRGMMQFRNARMTQPEQIVSTYTGNAPYEYSARRDMTANTDAIMAQNKLLQEQNELLRQIASKDVTISSRDVFNATRSEASNYYNRTGNSPFLY